MSAQDPHEEEALGKIYDSRLARRLLTYLKPYKGRVIAALILTVLSGVFVLAQPLLVLRLLDHAIPNRDEQQIAWICVAFMALMILEYISQYTYILLVNATGQKAMYDLRVELFQHLQQLSLSFFDKNPVGRLMTRVTGDIEVLNELFSNGVTIIIGALFMLVGILAILFWLNVKMTLLALCILPPILLVTRYFRVWSREGFRAVRTRIARLNAYLQENVAGLQTVQVFVREDRNLDKYKELNKDHYDANIQTIVAFSIFFPAVEIISSLAIGMMLWYGGAQVFHATVTLGVLVSFIQYLLKFFQPLRELSAQYGTLQSAMASSERIFRLLDEEIQVADPVEPVKPPETSGRIRFENVWFEYNPGEPVLRDVDFEVKSGEKVAFVGATGSGKTTTMSLLSRFYDVTKGRVLVDGVDVREWTKRDLRSRIAIVLQEVFLFSGTVEENVTLHEPSISREDVIKVCKDLGIYDLIQGFPKGLDTVLNERGRNLSVGERQLISFARAMAFDPQILVLDEATSSIDTETERIIQHAVERLMEGRTSLIVAHRLSTIQNCDRILVFNKGKIAESGTHEELLALNGLYYRLYELQYKSQEMVTPTAK
ncbi:MAG: ABC transporter ATP-binding protein [Candidatus Omnitrophica bacterium]|nr:ABC transporter ATP-binding protein [Candidatus Omnitrophota bacterium]